MNRPTLTTGKAARLCSVKSDTVLKWIKKGWLPATRTIGGHYRVNEQDVLSLRDDAEPGEKLADSSTLCCRPMRCWEYMNNGPGMECQKCFVYQVHAAWCFRLLGNGHARQYCIGPCQECPYYRRAHGLPANVLVITQDESLIQSLAKRENDAIAFRFARRGYDASAIVTVFRPAFVVFDDAILESLGVALLEALASDPRTPGTRIVVAISKGTMRRVRSQAIFAVLEKPFGADDVLAIVNRIPVETLSTESPMAAK